MSTTASTPQAGTGNANGIQLEMNNPQDNTGTLPPIIQVRVVHAGPRQQYRCHLLAIEALNQGEDLMAKLCRMLQADSGRISRSITACEDAFLMRHDSVWIVTVSLVSGSKRRLPHLIQTNVPVPTALKQRSGTARRASGESDRLHRAQRVQQASHGCVPPSDAASISEQLCPRSSERHRWR